MLSHKTTRVGTLDVTRLVFPQAGDRLPMHSHDAATVHITIVCKGRLRATGPKRGGGTWERDYSPGDAVDFRPGESHELIALEDDTVAFNIPRNVSEV